MYTEQKHSILTERMRDWMQNLDNAYKEAGDIIDIYTNETTSGADSDFVDNDIATKAEFIDAIVLMQRLRDTLAKDGQTGTITSEDQTARITPFLM